MRYTVSSDNFTNEEIEVNPLGSFKFVDKKRDDEEYPFAYSRECSGSMVFRGADFDYFNEIRDFYGCKEILIRVYRTNFGFYWLGKLSPSMGKWDLDSCTWEVEPKEATAFEVIELKKEEEVDIASIPSETIIFNNALDLTESSCFGSRNFTYGADVPATQCWDSDIAKLIFFPFETQQGSEITRYLQTCGSITEIPYQFKRQIYTFNAIITAPTVPRQTATYDIETVWMVENGYGSFGDNGERIAPTKKTNWLDTNTDVIINGDTRPRFIRQPYGGTRASGSFYDLTHAPGAGTCDDVTVEWNGATTQYPINGRKLNDVISSMLGQIRVITDREEIQFYTLQSNFLGINNIDDYVSLNYPSFDTQFDRQNLYLFHMSDVVRPTAYSQATRIPLNYEDIFAFFKTMNLHIRIDGNVIRIEHASFFEDDDIIDIEEIHPQAFAKKRVFEPINAEFPRKERFVPVDSEYPDFSEIEVFYNDRAGGTSPCVSNETTEFEIPFYTDLKAIADSKNDFPDEGIAIGSAPSGAIGVSRTILSNQDMPNEFLSFSRIFDNWHKHRKKRCEATFNGEQQEILSCVENKRAIEVSIPCDYIDPNKRYLTSLGLGRVHSSEYDPRTDFTTVVFDYA